MVPKYKELQTIIAILVADKVTELFTLKSKNKHAYVRQT